MEPGQLEKEDLGRNRSEISRKSSRESVCLSRKSSGEGFEGVYGAEKVSQRSSSSTSRPPSRLYEYNRRESSSYYKPMLNMLDAREMKMLDTREMEVTSSSMSSKSSMWGEEEVLVTEEEVGDFLVQCYAQKEKEKNLTIVARGTLLSRGPQHSGRPIVPRFSNAVTTRDFYVSALARMERDR